MINQNRTKPTKSIDFLISGSVTTIIEGAVLITQTEADGFNHVLPSAGSSGEIFAGIAYSQMMTPTTFPRVNLVTVPLTSPYTVTLDRTPVTYNLDISVKRNSNNTLLTIDNGGTTPATGHVALAVAGNVLTFNAADAGLAMTVVFRFNLSVAEAEFIAGDGVIGARTPVQLAGSVGVIQGGLVYTDQFDPTVDWTAPAIANLATGAGGRLTRGGSGFSLTNAGIYVIKVPQIDDPYLGIALSA